MSQSSTQEQTIEWKRYSLNPKEILAQVDEYLERTKNLPDYPFKENAETAFISLNSKIGKLKTISYYDERATHLMVLQLIISPTIEFDNILDYHFLHHHPKKDGHLLHKMDNHGLSYLKILVKEIIYKEISERYSIWRKSKEYLNWLRYEQLQLNLNEFPNFQKLEANKMFCKSGYEDSVHEILRPFIVNDDLNYLTEFLKSRSLNRMKVQGRKIGFLNTLKLLLDTGHIFPYLDHIIVADLISEIFYFEIGKTISKNTMHKYFNQHQSDKNPDKIYLLTLLEEVEGLN